MTAVQNNNSEVLRILLHHGANKNLRNNNNQTALDIAREQGNEDLINLLTSS